MRASSPRASTTNYHRVDGQGGSSSGKGTAAQGGPPEDFEAVSRRSRTQLALVACVGLVIMAGAAMSVYDQFLGPLVDPDDVGAPAVTGKPAARLVDAPGPKGLEGIEKLGAGLMLLSGGEVLLLKRNSLHNHDKWGLPGGNVDEGDDQALATAEREALEEMGSLPAYTVAGEIHTIRGRNKEKFYTVFLAVVEPDAKDKYAPLLNEEHSAWKWFPLQDAVKRKDLHPVVERTFKRRNRGLVLQAAGAPQTSPP